ncbi:MAG: hypothetical protein HY558_05705 [Euryarchaeota archaeon]|nr:hypothetical protein [Euryarchaeota archaeon]
MVVSRGARLLWWLGAGGTVASCAVTMVALPLAVAGAAASVAAREGSMAGMGSPPGAAGGDGALAGAAHGLLLISLPLVVLGLWGTGWPVRLLSAGGGGALYASMYLAPSGFLFALGGGGLALSYLWAWRRGKAAVPGPPTPAKPL